MENKTDQNEPSPEQIKRFYETLAKTLALLGQQMDGKTQEAFYEEFREWPTEAVCAALEAFRRDPDSAGHRLTPADLFRYLSGGKGTRALIAWDTAVEGIARVGCYGTVTFDDRLILEVIRLMGGWPAFCQMEEEEKPFRQREFIERYSALLARNVTGLPASLPGLSEQENALGKYAGDPRALEAGLPQSGDARRRPVLPEIPVYPALPEGQQGQQGQQGARPALPPVGGMSALGGMLKGAAGPAFDAEAYRRVKAEMEAREELRRRQSGESGEAQA